VQEKAAAGKAAVKITFSEPNPLGLIKRFAGNLSNLISRDFIKDRQNIKVKVGCGKTPEDIIELTKNNRESLETFNLSSYNSYKEDSLPKGLLNSLAACKNLHTLDFASNYISDEGTQEIADLVRENTTLEKLNLYNNNIGYKGAQAIAEALKENTNSSLEELSFGFNNIGDEGAEAIVKASLKVLGLSSNNIGPKGALEIAGALEKSTGVTLKTLDLSLNDIDPETAQAIADALGANKKSIIVIKENGLSIIKIMSS